MKKKHRNRIDRMFSGEIDQYQSQMFHYYDNMSKPKHRLLALLIGLISAGSIITIASIASLAVFGINFLGIMGLVIGAAGIVSMLTSIGDYKIEQEYKYMDKYRQIQKLKKDGSWEKIRIAVEEFDRSVTKDKTSFNVVKDNALVNKSTGVDTELEVEDDNINLL